MQPFRFHSIYQPRIWGGQSMRTMLGRELPDRETAYGEAWEISDRPEAMSIVKDGEWEGMSLHRLWEEHRQEIFGPGYERFPPLSPALQNSGCPRKSFRSGASPGTHGGSPAGRSKK